MNMPQPVRLATLQELVAAEFGTTVEALRARTFHKQLGPARQAFALLAVQLTANSYRTIAEVMNRDHSTVMTAEQTARALAERDADYAERLDRIRARCGRAEGRA